MHWRWWLMLALLLFGGCAARQQPNWDGVTYILIRDALPNDWRICVPLTPGSERHTLKCMRLWEFRLFLRRNESAD